MYGKNKKCIKVSVHTHEWRSPLLCCWGGTVTLIILIEVIPLCSKSKNKTKCLKLPRKHNNSVKILLFYCGNVFQSYLTICRPTFEDMRYNQYISGAIGSHSTWYALTVPHISEWWPEDGLIRLQHVATIK